jgi:hypothetical protein
MTAGLIAAPGAFPFPLSKAWGNGEGGVSVPWGKVGEEGEAWGRPLKIRGRPLPHAPLGRPRPSDSLDRAWAGSWGKRVIRPRHACNHPVLRSIRSVSVSVSVLSNLGGAHAG